MKSVFNKLKLSVILSIMPIILSSTAVISTLEQVEALEINDIFSFAKSKGIKDRANIKEYEDLVKYDNDDGIRIKEINKMCEKEKLASIIECINKINIDDNTKLCIGIFLDRITHGLDRVSYENGIEEMLAFINENKINVNIYNKGNQYVKGFIVQEMLYNYADWNMCWSFEQNYNDACTKLAKFLYSKSRQFFDKKLFVQKIFDSLKKSNTRSLIYKLLRSEWKSKYPYESLGEQPYYGIDAVLNNLQTYICKKGTLPICSSASSLCVGELNGGFAPPNRNKDNLNFRGYFSSQELYDLCNGFLCNMMCLKQKIHDCEKNYLKHQEVNEELIKNGKDSLPMVEVQYNKPELNKYIKGRLLNYIAQKKQLPDNNKNTLQKEPLNTSIIDKSEEKSSIVRCSKPSWEFSYRGLSDYATDAILTFDSKDHVEHCVFDFEQSITNDGNIQRIRSLFKKNIGYCDLRFDFESFYRSSFKNEAETFLSKNPTKALNILKKNIMPNKLPDLRLNQQLKNGEISEDVKKKFCNLYCSDKYETDIQTFLSSRKPKDCNTEIRNLYLQYKDATANYRKEFAEVYYAEKLTSLIKNIKTEDLYNFLAENGIISENNLQLPDDLLQRLSNSEQ